jgi:chemotaxis receptor (MCP) glutamine deamidase CheD
VLDDLPVPAQAHRLIRQKRHDVPAEPAVPRRFRQPQRIKEIFLGSCLTVCVIQADAGDRRNPAGGAH